jgi:hypothetical protein
VSSSRRGEFGLSRDPREVAKAARTQGFIPGRSLLFRWALRARAPAGRQTRTPQAGRTTQAANARRGPGPAKRCGGPAVFAAPLAHAASAPSAPPFAPAPPIMGLVAAAAPARRSPRAAAAVAASPPRSRRPAITRRGARLPAGEERKPLSGRRTLARLSRGNGEVRCWDAPRTPRPGACERPERAARPGKAAALGRPLRSAPCPCGAAAAPWPVISGDFPAADGRGASWGLGRRASLLPPRPARLAGASQEALLGGPAFLSLHRAGHETVRPSRPVESRLWPAESSSEC